MKRIDIQLTEEGFKGNWYAIDRETYDGAPDGNNCQGTGSTPWEAAHDLLDQLEEAS